MNSKKIDPCLTLFIPMVDCIADLFGSDCEVVLHDISDLEHSIIKIRNGHVTGRKVGHSMTDVGMEMIKEANEGLTVLGNYNPKTKSEKLLKSNAINIKNLKGEVIGILCINLDVSNLLKISQALNIFCINDDNKEEKEEEFGSDIWSIIDEIITKIVNKKGKRIHNLTREDRIKVIKDMDEKGIFLIKGSILHVSKALGISSPTIYKYLEEIRFINKQNLQYG